MVTFDDHSNLADTNLTNAPGTSGVSFIVTAGTGTWMPTPPFNATVGPATGVLNRGNSERVRVTGRTSDTLTVSRTQEGTTARNAGAGDRLIATPGDLDWTTVEAALLALYSAPIVPARRVIQPKPGTTDDLLVVADDGTIVNTYAVASYASTAECHTTAIQAGLDGCGSATPPTATGSTYVDRGGLCLLPHHYQVKETTGQSYGLLMPYGCSTIFGSEPPSTDRSTPSDELIRGAVADWLGGSGTTDYTIVPTQKALTSNVATITIPAGHMLSVGESVTVALSPADATFDGAKTVTAITTTSFSYSQTAANVSTTSTGGTVKVLGTAALPASGGTKALLQIGLPTGTGARRAANPHGAKLVDLAFIASASVTAFDFVKVVDTNDVETYRLAMSGNKGTGNSFVRHFSTATATDDRSVANRHYSMFGRNGYMGILTANDGTASTDGAIVDCRILAHSAPAVNLYTGGWLVGGHNSHYTTNSTGALNHIYCAGGGPFVFSDIYLDKVNASSTAAQVRVGGGMTNISLCHFFPAATGQLYCVDATASNAWKCEISDCEVNCSSGTAITEFVRFPNSVKSAANTITTTANAAAAATTISVSALGGALADNTWVRFNDRANGYVVHARLNGAASSSATSITVDSLLGAISSGTVGAYQPTLVHGITILNADALTANGFCCARTADGTVLDFLAAGYVDTQTFRMVNT